MTSTVCQVGCGVFHAQRTSKLDKCPAYVYNGTMPDKQDWWTTKELAEAAGVDVSYVRRLLLQGKIRGEKFGRDWAISDDVAKSWLALRAKQQKLDL